MGAEDVGKCCAVGFANYTSYPCGNKAKVVRDGRPYCGTHDPDRLQAIRNKNDEKWKARMDADKARYVRNDLCDDVCRGVTDDQLRDVIARGGIVALLSSTSSSD